MLYQRISEMVIFEVGAFQFPAAENLIKSTGRDLKGLESMNQESEEKKIHTNNEPLRTQLIFDLIRTRTV